MEVEGRTLNLKTEVSVAPSISIMESKRQISEIQNAIETYNESRSSLGIRNRQISSGVIVDWKQYEECEQVKSQLTVRDGQNDQKTIFSYVVEEWFKNQPVKVIYRWIRKPSNLTVNPKTPNLVEEQHIYRGPMRHYRKNGSGVYIIIKKYSDNSEKIKSIKGQWFQDILTTGIMTDQSGKEQILSSNILKIAMRSRKEIVPFLKKNQAIEQIRKKSMQMIPSGKCLPVVSAQAIMEKDKNNFTC